MMSGCRVTGPAWERASRTGINGGRPIAPTGACGRTGCSFENRQGWRFPPPGEHGGERVGDQLVRLVEVQGGRPPDWIPICTACGWVPSMVRFRT
jgi:hypothetical protein